MKEHGGTEMPLPADDQLFGDVATLIEGARLRAATAVNSEFVMLYWNVGKRVREEVLGGGRAPYAQDTVKRLATRLSERYGRGYRWRNLFRMMRAAEVFPEAEILSTLSTKLSWSHVVELLAIADRSSRDFYVAFAVHERWSVRTLRGKIAGKLYERTLSARGSSDEIDADLSVLVSHS